MNKHRQEDRIWCFRRWSRKPWAVFAALRRLKIGVLSVAMSIILLATDIAGAQTSGIPAEQGTLHLDTLLVAGSKTNPARSVLSQTRLFDRESEWAAPFRTTESALRLHPAIDLRERGGMGIQSDISIRGGSFDQTMVMLNGIDFSDARTGHQSHSLPVDPDCVSAIRVIDGIPGFGALAGAVDIRTAPLYSDYLRLHLSGGRWGYAYGNLSGAITSGGLSVFGAASYRRSDGYRRNTDFANTNAYARVTYDSSRAGFFDIQGGFQARDWGANGFYSLLYPDQFESTRTGLVSARWRGDWQRFALNVSGSYRKNFDRFELQRGDPSQIPFNYHDTDTAGAEAWADYGWRWGVTSLGADYRFNGILSSLLGDPLDSPSRRIPGTDGSFYTNGTSRHIVNSWLRHVMRWGRFDLAAQGGAGFSPYGAAGIWSASLGWRPFEGFRAELGAARSMRLPTFTDLYYSARGYHPDPDLVPEKATTFRLSAGYARRGWEASSSVYYRATRDVIDWQQRTDGEWYSTQLTRLGTFGAELTGGYTSARWRVSAGYGYVATDKDVPAGYISKYALDYLRHKIFASAGVSFPHGFSLALTGSFYDRTGSYVDAQGAVQSYRPYFLLDGRLAWERKWLELHLDATNMTDTRYFDFGGLAMPGAWISAGIAVTVR